MKDLRKRIPLDIQFFAEPNPGEPNPNPGAGTPNPSETTVPKYRFDEVNQRCQAAEAKVAELEKQVASIAEKDKRIADLEKELTDTKSGYELEKANAKKQTLIEAALKDKVVDMEVVAKLLDNEKITVDDKGALVGLDEQIKTLKEGKPYLWKKADPKIKPGGGDPKPSEKSFAQQLAEKKKAQQGMTNKSKNYF